MLFTASIDAYDDLENKEKEFKMFICANSISEATQMISSYYGENNLIYLSIAPFSPDDMLIFSSTDTEQADLFHAVKEKLEPDIIW